MVLVHVFFWTCILTIGAAFYYWVRLLQGRPQLDRKGVPLPWWVWAVFVGAGVLGVMASGPGLFFDRPYWFTDKLFWLVERLLG